MRTVSRTSGSGHFARVHFGLVSLKISLLVHVIFGFYPCSLAVMFSHVPGLVFTFFPCQTMSFCAFTLPRACALAIKFRCVPDFVFTFTCTRSSCSAESLFAALALPRTFALVE